MVKSGERSAPTTLVLMCRLDALPSESRNQLIGLVIKNWIAQRCLITKCQTGTLPAIQIRPAKITDYFVSNVPVSFRRAIHEIRLAARAILLRQSILQPTRF